MATSGHQRRAVSRAGSSPASAGVFSFSGRGAPEGESTEGSTRFRRQLPRVSQRGTGRAAGLPGLGRAGWIRELAELRPSAPRQSGRAEPPPGQNQFRWGTSEKGGGTHPYIAHFTHRSLRACHAGRSRSSRQLAHPAQDAGSQGRLRRAGGHRRAEHLSRMPGPGQPNRRVGRRGPQFRALLDRRSPSGGSPTVDGVPGGRDHDPRLRLRSARHVRLRGRGVFLSAGATPSPNPRPLWLSSPSSTPCCRRQASPVRTSSPGTRSAGSSPACMPARTPTRSLAWC